MVVVPKPDGLLRICIDFQGFNAVASFEAFPMPHVEELLEHIGQESYISTIGLFKGYWRIP